MLSMYFSLWKYGRGVYDPQDMKIPADPPPILHPMLGFQGDDSRSPLWVNTRRTGASAGRSAPGGEADEIRAKADIDTRNTS